MIEILFMFLCYYIGYQIGKRSKPIKHITIKMDAKEAADFIESDEQVRQLKKQLWSQPH